MDENTTYLKTMNRYIAEYCRAPGLDSLYAVLTVVFGGIEENYSLPAPVELNDEAITVSPLFVSDKDGNEYLVVLTDQDNEKYPVIANVKMRALLRLALSRETCSGIYFNPDTEKEFFIPKKFLQHAVSAGRGMAEDDRRQENDIDAESEEKYQQIQRPISEEEFKLIEDKIKNLRNNPDDFLVLNLKDDPDMLFIQVCRCGDECHVELAFDMSDFGWDYPLILGNELLPGVALLLLYELCVEGKSPDDMEIVQTSFRDMGFGRKKEKKEENNVDKSKLIRVKPTAFDTDWRSDLEQAGIFVPEEVPSLRYTPVNHDPIPFSMEIDLYSKCLVRMIYGVIPNAIYKGKIYPWEEFCKMLHSDDSADNNT